MGKRTKAAAEITHTAAKAAKAGGEAVDKTTSFVDQAREQLGPRVDEAMQKLSPAVDAAKERLDKDILPRISDALSTAADHPAAEEARKRGAAAKAALRGELTVPEPVTKKRNVVLPIILLLLTAGLAYVAWRKLAGDKDEWETYGNTSWNPSDDFAVKDESSSPDDATSQSFSEPLDVPEADSAAGEGGEETAAVDYGPGSYVGDEPSEEFPIKGNARSMKYHTPGTGGFERTNPDVWFADEAAAEAAGFTRAQR